MKTIAKLVLLSSLIYTYEAYAIDKLNDEDEESIYLSVAEGNTDPFEKFNRTIFQFNRGVDKVMLKPVSVAYKKLIPDFGKERIYNFLQNLHEPMNLLNGILQLDFIKSSTALSRFMINSSLGLGGIHDIATEAGLRPVKLGFSDTLKHYKISSGPYIVLPVIGSSSVRDAIGYAVDLFSDPMTYVLSNNENIIRTSLTIIDKRSAMLDVTDYIEQSSIDEYSSYRSLYKQKYMQVRP